MYILILHHVHVKMSMNAPAYLTTIANSGVITPLADMCVLVERDINKMGGRNAKVSIYVIDLLTRNSNENNRIKIVDSGIV